MYTIVSLVLSYKRLYADLFVAVYVYIGRICAYVYMYLICFAAYVYTYKSDKNICTCTYACFLHV